MPAF